MSTLAHDGRSAEALRAFADVRRILVEELGLEPGNELHGVEREVVAGRLPPLPTRRPQRPVDLPATAQHVVSAPATRFVRIDNIHIAHTTMASADPAAGHLILLNPGTLPVDCVLEEPHYARTIGLLASFVHVTWFDRRGIGLSERCTADQLPTTSDWTRDLTAVLDAISADAAVLLASEDTTAIALESAISHPGRIAGIILTNAYPRFTRSDDYPYGLDQFLAHSSVTDVTDPQPPAAAFDLLTVIAPSVANDPQFRRWWDNAGHRGATSGVAHALRARHHDDDIRHLLAKCSTPILHLVNPEALAHDQGHDHYLQSHLADITTVELPGPDELWWLDPSGSVTRHIEHFVRHHLSLS